MYINKITLIDFMGFKGEHSFEFDKITFIKGTNGKGKSTIGRIAPSFCLYGIPSTDKNLEDLPTKGTEKTSIIIEGILNDSNVRIERQYPTKLDIEINGKEYKNTNTEKNKYLKDKLYDINYFRKYRLIDKENGQDILSEGTTSFKKIFFANHEDYLNDLRNKLLKNKLEIENSLRAYQTVSLPFYPSIKRKTILDNSYSFFTKAISKIEQVIRDDEREIRKLLENKSRAESNKRHGENILKGINIDSVCITCGQKLVQNRDNLRLEASKSVDEAQKYIEYVLIEIQGLEEALGHQRSIIEGYRKRLEKVSYYSLQLHNKLNQKKCSFAEKDLEIVKQSIVTLDKFSSVFLINTIKELVPSINYVLAKTNFQVDFKLNVKNDFDLDLYKDGVVYKKSDLSTGQKLMLQIAFKLAILMQRKEYGTIIADEGLSSLDNENLLHIINIFKQLPFNLICMIHHFDNLPEDIKVIEL